MDGSKDPLEGPQRPLVTDDVDHAPHVEDQQALRQELQRLRALVERTPDGIFAIDLAGSFADVNTNFCRMLGYSREEIVGKAATDFISLTDMQRLTEGKVLAQ